MSERSWTITGYSDGAKTFEQAVAVSAIAESEIKELLRRLVSREFSLDSVVAASLSSEHRATGLDVTEIRDGDFGFTTDPAAPIWFTAILGEVEYDDEGQDEDAGDAPGDMADDG